MGYSLKTGTHVVNTLIILKIYLNISSFTLSLDGEIVKYVFESTLSFFLI